MIGLDANVLARHIAQDDPEQSPKATRPIESLTADAPGFVRAVSVAALVGVLAGCNGSTKSELYEVLQILLRTEDRRWAG